MIDEGGIIRNEEDLIHIHNAISEITNQKVKNDIEEKYGRLLKDSKIMGMKIYETEDEREELKGEGI